MSRPNIDLSALLDELADVIAERVANRMQQKGTTSEARYYDCKTYPLGRRAFHRDAKAGCFPVFKADGRGRLVARVEDVHRYIESQDPVANDVIADAAGVDPLDAMLASGQLRRGS